MIFTLQEPIRQVGTSLIISLALAIGLLTYSLIFKKKLNLLVTLILISILPVISIFRAGTYQAGDLKLHSVYLQSFYENLKNGILIPQWAGGLCGGYGCPIFQFEYTLPFYIGSIFHLFGFSFLNSIKLFLASSYILSGITMYIFIKDAYGKIPALTSSILYLYAPIHLIEMHFRVSVGTDAAFIFIPLAFLFAKKSLDGNKVFIILGGINFLLLILSHSSITFVTIPLALIYAFLISKNKSNVIYPIFSILLGLGISSYYFFPALLELQYTWYSQTITEPVGPFFPLLYYIYSPSHFGFSFQGNNGELRLIVGYAQLVIVLIGLIKILTNTITKTDRKIAIFLILTFVVLFSLMLPISKPIWNNIFFLKSFVLPWRMLVPIAFIIAFLAAIITNKWKNKAIIIFCIFTVFSTILNWGNRKMVPLASDAYNTEWILYTEYFNKNDPIYLKRYNLLVTKQPEIVKNRPLFNLEILSGKGNIKEVKRTQIYHEYNVNAKTNLKLLENTYYFPGWKVYVDGNNSQIDIKNNKKFGAMIFSVNKGFHNIKIIYEDTLIRKTGKLITTFSLIIIFLILTKNYLAKFSNNIISYIHRKHTKSKRKIANHSNKKK